MAVEIEMRAAVLVEHRDQCRVADAEQRALQRDGVADMQRAHLRFGDRRFEDVVSHDLTPSLSLPLSGAGDHAARPVVSLLSIVQKA